MGLYQSKYTESGFEIFMDPGSGYLVAQVSLCNIKELPKEYVRYTEDGNITRYYLDEVSEIMLDDCPNIKRVPYLPLLRKIICKNCPALEELPDTDTITHVHLENCKNITKLQKWKSLRILTVDSCPIHTVYDWNLLYSITLNNCKKLRNLFYWINLESANLSKLNISVLQNWPNIIDIIIYKLPIYNLPNWRNIEDAQIDGCKYLENIPCWSVLKEIKIIRCPKVKELPCWTEVKSVYYEKGSKKIKIPNWPSNPKLNDFLKDNMPIFRRYTISVPKILYKESECIICVDRKPEIIFKCGHTCLCQICCDKVYIFNGRCILCKQECFPLCKNI